MRYILIILFLWGGALWAQPEITRTNGANTVNDPNLMASKSLRLPVYADTSSANVGLDSAGKIIFSKVDTSIYIRGGLTGHLIWKKIAGSTGGGGGLTFVVTDSTLTGHGTSSDSLRVNFNRVQKKIIFGTGTIYSGDTLSIDFANAAALGITGSVQYKGSDGKQKGDAQNVWDSSGKILKIGTSGTTNGQILAGNNATGTFKAGGDGFFQGNNITLEALGTGNLIKLRNNGADKIAIDQNGGISLNGLGNYGNNGQFLKSQGSGAPAVWGFPDTSRSVGSLITKYQFDSAFNTLDTIAINNVGAGVNMVYGTSNSINVSRLQAGLGTLITKQNDSSTKAAVDTTGTNGVALKSWALANISPNAYVQGGNSFGALATIGTNDASHFAIKTNGSEIFRFLSGGGFTDSTNRQFYKYRLGDTTSLKNLFIGDDESATAVRIAAARLQVRGRTNSIGEKLIYLANSLNQATIIAYSSYQAQICDALFGAGGTTLNNSQYTFTGSNSAGTGVTSIRLTKSTTTTATTGKQIEVAIGPSGAGATFGPSSGSASFSSLEIQGNVTPDPSCTGMVAAIKEGWGTISGNSKYIRSVLTTWPHVQFGGGQFGVGNSRYVTAGIHMDEGFPITTTNATPTNIDTIPTSAGQAYVITFEIKVAMGTTYSFFTRKVRCSNNAGTITAFPLQGIGTDDIGSGMSGISFSTATSGNDLYLVITGLAATTLITSTIKHYGEFR